MQWRSRLLVLVAPLAAASCSSPPGTAAGESAIAALPRAEIAVPALGLRLSYLHAGDPNGRRVIFVHGTPGDASGWGDFMLAVPPGHEYVAVDRPGFGESGPDGALVSLADQARAIEPLLVKRDGHWPILVGHSLGGPIVARVAADFPGQVEGLVIAAGSLDPSLEAIHWAQPIAATALVSAMLPRSLRNANAELMALKPELEALAPILSGITCPVILVHGTEDRLVPYANIAFIRARMTGTAPETITLQGQNHYLPWNSAPSIAAAIAKVASQSGSPC